MSWLAETSALLLRTDAPVGFLLLLLAKATLVVGAGFAAALLLRRASAAARHVAWCATFLGLLLLPVLSLWGPELPLPLLPAPEETPAPDPGAATARPAPLAGAAPPGTTGPGTAGTAAARPTSAARVDPALDPLRLLGGVYLLGAAGLLAFLLAGVLRARALGRRARRLDPEPGWRGLLASLKHALGLRREVSVRASERVTVPLAWGLRRPTVLLPEAADEWGEAQRRDVLVHELAHVARHDWVVQLAVRAACALYWFHPLVWAAAGRLVLEAERACDDRVLAAGADSCDYAERLLRVAGAAREARDPSYAAVAMARRSDLATRIQAILDGGVRRGALRGAPAALLTAALLVPAGLLGAASPTAAEAPVADPAGSAAADSASQRGAGASRVEDLPPLLRAAHEGDLAEARRLLDAGADPNRTAAVADVRRGVQRSALGGAVRGGHGEVAELLHDRGARVDLTPRGDASPLMIAARHGHQEMVRLLLDRGADPNRVVPGDGTPLIEAVRSGEERIVRLLLDAGADPDTWVDGDESPLFHAVHAGDRPLLDAGADPNAVWPGDGNALIVASARGRDDLVDLLLAAGADVDQGVEGDGNAMIQAAARGDVETVRRLLAAGADPNAAVRGDGNALIRAAANGHLEVLRLLVDSGGDFETVVPGDENPLIQAAGGGHLEVVRYLLEEGADPNVRVVIPPSERWGTERRVRTPLSQARRGGHDAVVRLLLAHGATAE